MCLAISELSDVSEIDEELEKVPLDEGLLDMNENFEVPDVFPIFDENDPYKARFVDYDAEI